MKGRRDSTFFWLVRCDEPYEVVGVMPRKFYFMPSREIDLWLPASFPQWIRATPCMR